MEQIKDKISEENLEKIRLIRQLLREPQETWTGKLEQAKRLADEATERTGMKTLVIKKKRKYDWVFEPYFDTYKYKGKIYYESEPNLDAEV